jgi:hypothetical protein
MGKDFFSCFEKVNLIHWSRKSGIFSMRIYPKLILILFFSVSVILSISGAGKTQQKEITSYQFAREYTNEIILNNKDKCDEFVEKFLRSEAKFNQPGVGYNENTGLTYDGYAVTYITGDLIGVPHVWSASSKESLHIMSLTLAVAGVHEAQIFVSPDDPSKAQAKAISILTKKINSYENFNKNLPGFGGFLPWFLVSDEGMEPTAYADNPEWDWTTRVPGLDNGQLAWSLFLAADVLENNGFPELAARYKNYWQMLAANAVTMFFDEQARKIRAEVKINDIKAPVVTRENYSNNVDGYFLSDAYEGELFVLFMTFFGKWENKDDVDNIWKTKKMNKAVFRTRDGQEITVREGHWFSAHEMWNFLVLPYRDDPLIKEVFRLGEIVRTYYSYEKRIPGLYASVNPPPGSVPPDVLYMSDVGVPGVSKMSILYNHVVTPYGSFPVIVADREVGLTWLRTMMAGPRMQGPYGTTEAITVDGRLITPLVTWDAKVTTVLSLMERSIMANMRTAMKGADIYDKFIYYVGKKYKETFGSIELLKGRQLSLKTPSAEIPLNIPDFYVKKEVKKDEATDILKGTVFYGGGDVLEKYKINHKGILTLPKGLGYIWNGILHTDLSQSPVINFTVKTLGGKGKGTFVEIKNTINKMITGDKLRIEFPCTEGEFETYSLDVRDLIKTTNPTAAIFVLSDPNVDIDFRSITFTQRPIYKSKILTFDGRRFAYGVTKDKILQDNILNTTTFIPGGDISYVQDRTLVLDTSVGWLWGFVPKRPKTVDLKESPYLNLTIKTNKMSSVMVELKHKTTIAEEQLIADPGSTKMRIWLPNTHGKYKKVHVRLRLKYDMRDKTRADIMAISDPQGRIEIAEMSFSKNDIQYSNKKKDVNKQKFSEKLTSSTIEN